MNEFSPTVNSQNQPLTGKALILHSRKFAIENRWVSWTATLSTLVFLLGSFALTFTSIHVFFKLLFSVLFGLFIVRFFVIYHDYQHGAILKGSNIARLIMRAFGGFILAPPNIWKRTHNHHHQHNSKLTDRGVGSYPLLSKKDYLALTSKKKMIYLIKRHPVTIFSGYITLFILDFNVITFLRSPSKHWDSVFVLIFHCAVGVSIYVWGGFPVLFFSWLLPFIFANGFGAYIFYAQHNFPGAVFAEGKDWDYTKAALLSTSYLKMGPVMAWFTGNIGYHHVHHINHRIPFYRLKEAMDEIPELQDPKTTSLYPMEIYRCLRLKIWDEEKGKMTGIKKAP
jgi:omega-6 fatty acid desaturase (delta-12 desaturase)